MTNKQNMNNSDMSTQEIPNLHVYSLDEGESKSINAEERKLHVYYTDERKQKKVIVNVCYLGKSESKSVHTS